MTPTLRAELDRIEDFLMGPEGKQLADVLSALRGPDAGGGGLKFRTTNFIRTAAFPKLTEASQDRDGLDGSANDSWMLDRNGEHISVPTGVNKPSYHFLSHIESAARVLDLPFPDDACDFRD